MSSFLRNISAYKQSQYIKVWHWDCKYTGVCRSEGPRPVSNGLDCKRARWDWVGWARALHGTAHGSWLSTSQTVAGVAELTAPLASRYQLSFAWPEGRRHGPWPVSGGQPVPPTAVVGPSVQTQPGTSCNHLPFPCNEVIQDLFQFYMLI